MMPAIKLKILNFILFLYNNFIKEDFSVYRKQLVYPVMLLYFIKNVMMVCYMICGLPLFILIYATKNRLNIFDK